ncbi:hypothetical protein C8J57DRAFT_1713566 [Mycena rebaudengoi]|nr:hypothetical protein C8J57DRAFT_1713566 [Mycena rebaudengoi]
MNTTIPPPAQRTSRASAPPPPRRRGLAPLAASPARSVFWINALAPPAQAQRGRHVRFWWKRIVVETGVWRGVVYKFEQERCGGSSPAKSTGGTRSRYALWARGKESGGKEGGGKEGGGKEDEFNLRVFRHIAGGGSDKIVRVVSVSCVFLVSLPLFHPLPRQRGRPPPLLFPSSPFPTTSPYLHSLHFSYEHNG